MTLEELEPVHAGISATFPDDDNDDDNISLIDDDDDDYETLTSGLSSTQAEQRREQKAIFESWLQTEAAQQPLRRHKRRADEEADDEEHLSIQSLMARQESAEIVKNPREYQLELFERAKQENTIAVLDTGSGKTLIAVLLIRWMIDQELELRAAGHDHKITFFLVVSVTLVFQQYAVLKTNLDHKIAHLYGAMNVDTWDKTVWDQHFSENRVIVCTADILLQCLSRSFITIPQINLLVFDEAHHTKKNHAYSRIIKDYYLAEDDQEKRPRIFGMTASPADSKSDVTQAAVELETLLHSRIATATDLSFQQILKSKDERILQYGPLKPAFETEFLSVTKARFKHVTVFHKIFNMARDTAAELGSWCADLYLATAFADNKLCKYEALLEQNFNACSVGKQVSDLDDAIAEVRNASGYVSGRWGRRRDRDDDLSDKVRELMKFLAQEFERPSNYRCLVFVNQRHYARLLCELFKRQDFEHLRPGFLTGARKSDLTEANYSLKEQVKTMTKFRTGQLNCLFVTSVAEEGLDVPDCNVVVRFSLYNTMVQYVQSRGRARQANSRFIHMIERGNSIQEQILIDVRHQEVKMRSFCKSLPKDRYVIGNEDALEFIMGKEKGLKFYVEPSTKAKLTYGNALVTLANFVSAIPTDSDEPQHPTYVVMSSGSNFTAEVMLPAGAPFRSFVGDAHSKKTLAKRSAAFRACLELRGKSLLNAYFLPIYAKNLPAMRNAHLAVNSKKAHAYEMKTKPLLWEQGRGNLPEQLYITIVDFPGGLEREHRPFAMLTRTSMPQFPTFPIFLDDGKQSQVVSYPVDSTLSINDRTLSLITAFTLRVFKDIFSKKYESDPCQLSYWLAPINASQHSSGGKLPAFLDWDLMLEVTEHEEYTWTADMPNEALVDRFIIDKWDGGRKFYSKGVSQNLKPLDPVPKGTAKGKWKKNILEYSNSMFKSTREKFKDTWDLNQPVMETEKVLARRDMLTAPVPKELKDSTQAFLCPQPLQISVFPPSVAAPLFTWPAIIWRWESYLIALEAVDLVGVQCQPDMALAAITKDSDNGSDHDAKEQANFQLGMGSNYERLEFLGDCFLKTATTISTFIQNPRENEFEFHVRRMVMLCNKNLFEVALELELHKYIRSRAFSRRLWYPEGLKLLVGKGAQQTEETVEEQRLGSTHDLSEKTIADVCEAMIGAAFLSHNQPGNWNSEQWENAIGTVTKLVKSKDHHMLKWEDYRAAYEIPEYQVATATASQRDMAEKVEKEHDYRFQYPRLLRSAFVHPSQPFLYENVPNYQRLEFLGDALLDQASITYLFYKFPDKDPQWLTEHKMAMVGNRALGMIAVTIGFHKHIRHCHATVEQSIRNYATELQEAKEAAGPGVADYWTTVSDPPKCLADMVEAYLGAIFIDSNFDYNEVQRFFDKHIQPHFDDMSLYDGYANNHPCTHLHHLIDQTYGCQRYRIIARQIMLPGAFESKGVVVAVMIHNEVFTHDMGESVRYARVRVAKMAIENLEGLGPAEYRTRFKCDCLNGTQVGGGGDDAGVRADCGI
jgi:endoribonuclease Dicer